jgi:hypothetical protein
MPDTDVNQTRKDLSGCFGEVAIKFGALDEAQRQAVLKTQARYLALANMGSALKTEKGWVAASDINDDQKYQALLTTLKVDPTAFAAKLDEANQIVSSGRGMASAAAPSTGDIASNLGYITPEVKVPLLTAKAAERTLQVAKRIYTDTKLLPDYLSQQVVVPSSDEVRKQKFLEVVNAPKWQRIGENKNEPMSLQRAQAVNFLGEVLKTMIEHSPSLVAGDERTAGKMLNAVSALETLSIASLMQASATFPAKNEQASNRIRDVAVNIGARRGKGSDISNAQIGFALDILDEGLNTAKTQYQVSEAEWAQVQSKLELARAGLGFSQNRSNDIQR